MNTSALIPTEPANSEANVMIAVQKDMAVNARLGIIPRVPSFGELRGDVACGGSTQLSRTFYTHFHNGVSPDLIASVLSGLFVAGCVK